VITIIKQLRVPNAIVNYAQR